MKKLIIDKKSLFLQTELAKDKSLKSKDNFQLSIFNLKFAPIVQRIERKFPKL